MVRSPLDPAVEGAGAPAGEHPVCSARSCRRPAVWALRWNNPRIHSPQRRKVWTACDEHRAGLESFLRSRGFLRDTAPVGGPGSEPVGEPIGGRVDEPVGRPAGGPASEVSGLGSQEPG